MIVVDIGCHTHGDADSMHTLIARFGPRILFGFDPHPENLERVQTIGATTVVTSRRAAWISDGTQPIHLSGSRTRVRRGGNATAHTFDLAAWLFTLPRVPTVLKIDAEGAEHRLLPHLRHHRADKLLDLILVEWHGTPQVEALACPVEEWMT